VNVHGAPPHPLAGLQAVRHRSADLRDAEAQLTELLEERARTVAMLDRAQTLRALPHEVLAEVGVDTAFVGQVEDGRTMALRNLAGMQTPLLQDLLVHRGRGLGGAAMLSGRPESSSNYATDRTFTHDFDAQVLGEGLLGVVAVPILYADSFLGILYAGMRTPHVFGDVALSALTRLASRAGAQLHVSEQVTAQVRAAVQEERSRMAVELHDSLGAMLFSIGAQVRDLHGDPQTSPDLAARLERIQEQLRDAGSALRESLTALRSDVPAAVLPASLRSDCRAFEARSGTRARTVVLGELPVLDEHRTAAVSAAVREALVNIEKHAQACSVMITAVANDGGVLVAVSDDGRGTASSGDGHGMGLTAARDRLEQVGGRLTSFSDEDGGWTVRAWVPHL
jgi:signal transduction histidine kinase